MSLRLPVCVAAAAPVLIAASYPMRLQPSTKWVLDYATDSCRLSRVFGTNASKTILQFESTAPGELSMISIGRPLDTDLTAVPAKFLPVSEKAFTGQPEKAANGEPGILWEAVPLLPYALVEFQKKKGHEERDHNGIRPPRIDLQQRAAERAARQAFAAAANELEVDTYAHRPVILETGSLGAPIEAFDQCSRNSLRDWGVDPDVDEKIVKPVWAPDPQRWFSSADYPAKMLDEGKESEVRVRVLVDAAGNITKCTSLSHFDEPKFNEAVCNDFTKRAKFEPAELADGTKVPSYYIERVVFRIQR